MNEITPCRRERASYVDTFVVSGRFDFYPALARDFVEAERACAATGAIGSDTAQSCAEAWNPRTLMC
eukprot:scaffold22641_cov206-Cylindrotheca_fusiformis.AAC.2